MRHGATAFGIGDRQDQLASIDILKGRRWPEWTMLIKYSASSGVADATPSN